MTTKDLKDVPFIFSHVVANDFGTLEFGTLLTFLWTSDTNST